MRIMQLIYRNGNLDRAVLAGLRNATNLTSPQAQVVWPVLMANLDQAALSRTGEPTHAETAVFTALKFYAQHQQGNAQRVFGSVRDETGISLFTAAARLSHVPDNQTRIDNRMKQLLKVTNTSSAINALAHLVDIVKSGQQPIDYAQLAEDLYWFQDSFEQANRVRLRWGQTYYWRAAVTEEEK
jgi:CRISPR system Cascade subunit CasB